VDVYFDEVRRLRSGVVIVDFGTLDPLNAVIAALDATLFADGAALSPRRTLEHALIGFILKTSDATSFNAEMRSSQRPLLDSPIGRLPWSFSAPQRSLR
jgi:hypothetical protein